jgi:hypothetical protein
VVQELESRLALSPLTLTWAPENQSTDWYVAANWSANWDANNVQRAPNQTDDVNIPSDTDACFLTGDPQTGGFAYAKSITISGGNLAARAGVLRLVNMNLHVDGPITLTASQGGVNANVVMDKSCIFTTGIVNSGCFTVDPNCDITGDITNNNEFEFGEDINVYGSFYNTGSTIALSVDNQLQIWGNYAQQVGILCGTSVCYASWVNDQPVCSVISVGGMATLAGSLTIKGLGNAPLFFAPFAYGEKNGAFQNKEWKAKFNGIDFQYSGDYHPSFAEDFLPII